MNGYTLQFDGGVGNPPSGKTLHLMVPKYRPVPGKGMVEAPLMTGFMPFPFVQKHMMKAMQDAKQLPESKREEKMAILGQVKEMMGHTKEHVMEETKAGKMAGMPFFHVMFGNVEIETSH